MIVNVFDCHYQIQKHIKDVIHVLASKVKTMSKACCIENKIWTNTTWENTNCDKVGEWQIIHS
jgi:hypothetical protein